MEVVRIGHGVGPLDGIRDFRRTRRDTQVG